MLKGHFPQELSSTCCQRWVSLLQSCFTTVPGFIDSIISLRTTLCVCACVCVCVCVCMNSQSYPTVCDPMECILLGPSVHGKNIGVGCHFLLQGIFPTQGSNSCLLVSCIDRWIIYHCTTWEALILTSLSVIDIDSYAFIATC